MYINSCSTEKDGVLRYNGRILDDTKINNVAGIMLDLHPLTFSTPILDRHSPVAYAVVIYAHTSVTRHGGGVSTHRAAMEVAQIINGKTLANEVVKNCNYCKRYKMKLTEAAMAKQHEARMTIAPAFYYTQVDLFGPFEAFCKHGRRSTIKVYGLVMKCSTTLAVAAYIMDSYSTESFLDAFFRFASRYGIPGKLFIDGGSQLLKACNTAELSIGDITKKLNGGHNIKIEFETCPVGGHNMHGAVERQIREIRRVLHAMCNGVKMDVLQWETALAWASNELNSLPMALGNKYTNMDSLDLITPARLLLGRNNRRAIGGFPQMESNSRWREAMSEIETAWWRVWMDEKLADMVPQPKKWRTGEPELAAGDVVVFMRDQAALGGPTWRIGEISEVERGTDGIIRTVTIKYKNCEEKVYRYTRRAVRAVAVLWREHELDMAGELSAAQKMANLTMYCSDK